MLERRCAQRRAATNPDLHERLEASSSPRLVGAGDVPGRGGAARGARPRRRCTAASAATCCSPTRRSTRAGSPGPRAAIALARRALVSGELVASGALGFQFAAFSLVGAGLLRRGDRRLRRRPRRGRAARRLLRAAPMRMFRARAGRCAATSTLALAELREALERRSARRARRRSRTRSASWPRRCSSAASRPRPRRCSRRRACWTSCR